jgi:hypothetical protein
MKIIISVPHGFCPAGNEEPEHERECDLLAPAFAMSIENNLKDLDLEVELHVNGRLRSDVDMNRKWSRDTAFRKRLDSSILNLSRNDVVLDVHSAPGDTLRRKSPWINNFDLYFLNLASSLKDDAFVLYLNNFLKASGIKSYNLKGDDKNDIIFRAVHDADLSNVSLIEINESTEQDVMHYIAKLLACRIYSISKIFFMK